MTKEIFINLKRFEVPRELGGICPVNDPAQWIKWVIDETVKYDLHLRQDIKVIYLLPEALILAATKRMEFHGIQDDSSLAIGCQSVYRENIQVGGNFGAFTSNLPAASAVNLGCKWAMIGHSEERKDKLGIIEAFDPTYRESYHIRREASSIVGNLLNKEVVCALKAGLDVLFCIGETQEEKGLGDLQEQKGRIEKVLRDQMEKGLRGIEDFPEGRIVIGYEPIWAIGPGKTPPNEEYIEFVSGYIKRIGKDLFNRELSVVYGGGLKEDNAEMIAGIRTIDGGLVGLTTFTGQIGFEPENLKKIIDKYH